MLKKLLRKRWFYRFTMGSLVLLMAGSLFLWWVLAPWPRASWQAVETERDTFLLFIATESLW